MKRTAQAVLFVFLLACTPFSLFAAHGDYIDFVKWNGIDYWNSFATVGRQITDADLGPEHFWVKRTLATASLGFSYQIQDGDAAYVATGEPVYTVRGYAPSFRLAARRDGRLTLYEAHNNPAAKEGRDLFDIEGKVFAIAILDQKRNTTIIGRIAEPSRVEALVRLVLDGHVGGGTRATTPPPRQSAAKDEPTVRPALEGATVVFELKDGTATVRGYDLTTSILSPNLAIAGTFRDAIATLVANAPTPTPAPAVVNLAKRYDLAKAQSVTVKRRAGPGSATPNVAEWAAAFDADMPATRSDLGRVDGDVVIFSFPDRSVSLVYDRANDALRVAVPDDELAVRATDAFKALLAR